MSEKMNNETYIWCNNYTEFSELMKILDSRGYTWYSGTSVLKWDPYPKNREHSKAIEIEIMPDYTIRYGFYASSKESSNNSISFTAFKIKEGIKVDKFTKADLEDGMIIELRDGRCYMYFKKFNKGVRYAGFISLKEYNDDLCCVSDNEFDIVAVYSPKDLTSLDFKSTSKNLNLIWKRPEEVVMTIAEIEEKLGIKNLKVVKEKN